MKDLNQKCLILNICFQIYVRRPRVVSDVGRNNYRNNYRNILNRDGYREV